MEGTEQILSVVSSVANVPEVSGLLNVSVLTGAVNGYNACVDKGNEPTICAVAEAANAAATVGTIKAGEAILAASAAAVLTGRAPVLGAAGLVAGTEIIRQSDHVGSVVSQAVVQAGKHMASGSPLVEPPQTYSHCMMENRPHMSSGHSTKDYCLAKGVRAEMCCGGSGGGTGDHDFRNMHYHVKAMTFMDRQTDKFISVKSRSGLEMFLVAEILDLFGKGYPNFSMSFENTRHEDSGTQDPQVVVDTVFKPDILRSYRCGHLMFLADETLKTHLFRYEARKLNYLEDKIRWKIAWYDNKGEPLNLNMEMSAFFLVKPFRYTIEHQEEGVYRLVVSDQANISLKCHSYKLKYDGDVPKVAEYVAKREQLIQEFEEHISSTFNTVLKQKYQTLFDLETFGRALTIANIIINNHVGYNPADVSEVTASRDLQLGPPVAQRHVMPINAKCEYVLTTFITGGVCVCNFDRDDVARMCSLEIAKVRRLVALERLTIKESGRAVTELVKDRVLKNILHSTTRLSQELRQLVKTTDVFDRFTGDVITDWKEVMRRYGTNMEHFVKTHARSFGQALSEVADGDKAGLYRAFFEWVDGGGDHPLMQVLVDNCAQCRWANRMLRGIWVEQHQQTFFAISVLFHLERKLGQEAYGQLVEAMKADDGLERLRQTCFKSYATFKYLGEKTQEAMVQHFRGAYDLFAATEDILATPLFS